MAIITWPDDVQIEKTVLCVACNQEILLSEATAGAVDVYGKQAFACNDHFWNGTQLIRGWTEFALAQQAEQQQWELSLLCAGEA
jgi:hypothetical protein